MQEHKSIEKKLFHNYAGIKRIPYLFGDSVVTQRMEHYLHSLRTMSAIGKFGKMLEETLEI